MEPDRRQRIQGVALEAMGRSAAERAAYLDAACAGDAALRDEVDSLLAGQAQAALFDTPPWAAPAAPLTPGTRLGPYAIGAAIGAGGMGEVYRATDTRLGRTVAIKVLPSALAADAERRRRFEREARAVSALNHPHICALHDIGAAVPSSPESRVPSPESRIPIANPVHYLVLTHLDGQTLAVLLQKGPLPVAHVLEVGAQIADALSAAHKAGIIHRDLKPANVMLSKAPAGADGRSGLHATLMDFGLAKLAAHGERPAIDVDAAAASSSLTERGLLLGTVPYMAPEQVEGKPVDARADIWALGALLYEMLTGARAFVGDTPTKIAAAILEHEPPPLASLQPQTPPPLARLVTKCLAKDPDARWDSAHDVADELRWIAEPSRVGQDADARPRRRRSTRVALLAVGLLVGLTIGAGVMSLVRPAAPGLSLIRPSLDVGPAEELNAGGVSTWIPTPGGSRTALAWTPDGQALVFVGRRRGVQQLYVRRLDAAEARPLAGTEGAQVPSLSADGQWVAFWAGGAIRKVPLGGGPVMELATGLGDPPRGMVWDDRGHIYFSAGRDIRQIRPDKGPEVVTTLGEAELLYTLPWPLPGGKALLFTVRKRYLSWGDDELVALTLSTGARKLLMRDATDARYVPTGHLVFMRRGALFAVRFDPERLEVHGEAVAVLDNVAQALTSYNTRDIIGAGQFAVASTGTLALIPSPTVPYPDTALAVVDRHGRAEPLPAPPRSYHPYLKVSRDGRIAMAIQSVTGSGVWLYDIGRDQLTLVSADAEVSWPFWTADGRRLGFAWTQAGRRSLATQPADGSGPPQDLQTVGFVGTSWAPDGLHVAGLRSGDIVIVSVGDNGVSARPWLETPPVEMWPEFSPDGRWLAYGSDESGRLEIYVRPYPGPGKAVQVSFDGGESPAWNPSGKELFFLSNPDPADRRKMMSVEFDARSSLRIGRPSQLFEFDRAVLRMGGTPVRCYDVAPDGQRFYAVLTKTLPPTPKVTHISLIPNWFEALKAKVPVK